MSKSHDMARRPMTITTVAIGWWSILGFYWTNFGTFISTSRSCYYPQYQRVIYINSYCYMQVIIFDTIQYQCVSLSTKQYHFATHLILAGSPRTRGTGISCARGISSPLTWVKGSGVVGRLVGWGWGDQRFRAFTENPRGFRKKTWTHLV